MSTAFKQLIGGDGYFIRLGGDECAALFTAGNAEQIMADSLFLTRELLAPPADTEKPLVAMSMGMLSMDAEQEIDPLLAYRLADEAVYEAKQRKHQRGEALNLSKRRIPHSHTQSQKLNVVS